MITGAAHRELQPNFRGEPIYSVGAVILSGIVLTIIQDYLFTVRHNTSFVFYESLLFKCVWVVFGLAYMFSNKYFYKVSDQYRPSSPDLATPPNGGFFAFCTRRNNTILEN
ncbi:hypothetical protein AVL55_12625 [Alteromonas macleodii]|uniref:Uncharacterized protein n=1 Tax=Alteromonas macleodii TaxID=28108 RepID=A0A126Q3C9_ALTMA|nr:hypothetical protein AVL55_12625 [Alteromonas macleodii]